MTEYIGMICPHCGAQTTVDPALVMPDDPMIYCKECDKPLFDETSEPNKFEVLAKKLEGKIKERKWHHLSTTKPINVNKEIIFKGLNKKTNEWVEGYYVFCRSHHYILQIYTYDSGYDDRWETSDWVEISRNSLAQYTGYTYNDKFLFDGDILKSLHYQEGDKLFYLHHKIVWDEKYLCWKAVNVNNVDEDTKVNGNPQLWVYLKNTPEFDIVGSIHTHTELLNQQP